MGEMSPRLDAKNGPKSRQPRSRCTLPRVRLRIVNARRFWYVARPLVGDPMAFFGPVFANDAINRVNVHYGIQALAQSGGGVFFLVFLLRAGVSVPASMLAMVAILAGRLVIRPAILPLAKRWGMKPLLIVGTLLVAMQYPMLAEVHGVGPALFALCVVGAIADVFYWPS